MPVSMTYERPSGERPRGARDSSVSRRAAGPAPARASNWHVDGRVMAACALGREIFASRELLPVNDCVSESSSRLEIALDLTLHCARMVGKLLTRRASDER